MSLQFQLLAKIPIFVPHDSPGPLQPDRFVTHSRKKTLLINFISSTIFIIVRRCWPLYASLLLLLFHCWCGHCGRSDVVADALTVSFVIRGEYFHFRPKFSLIGKLIDSIVYASAYRISNARLRFQCQSPSITRCYSANAKWNITKKYNRVAHTSNQHMFAVQLLECTRNRPRPKSHRTWSWVVPLLGSLN